MAIFLLLARAGIFGGASMTPVTTDNRITEGGDNRVTEAGDNRVTEGV